MRTSPAPFARGAALGLLAACALACGNKPGPTPNKEPPAPTTAPSVASAAPSASAAASVTAAPTIPTLVKEKFAETGSVYAVEGAVMVVKDFRVGRIVDDHVEWLKKTIPKENTALGPNMVTGVVGRWPDGIGALWQSTNGRAIQPTYTPLTGVGIEYTAAPGGGYGTIFGVARIGESTLLAAESMLTGVEFTAVRGTVVRKPQTPEQAGCKPVEARQFPPPPPALAPRVIAATPEGTLISLGSLCDERGPAAEIWDRSGKSRIVDLKRWWKKTSYWSKLLPGPGDEMWAISDAWTRVLHYRNGAFETVPDLPWPIAHVFVSTRGELHATDGRTIHRFDGQRWVPVAQIAEAGRLYDLVMDDKDTLWTSGIHRLRPGPTVEVPTGCATPFVYLYQTSSKNGPKFTYPATRKALATFPEAAALGLVEYEDAYETRLGVTVTSTAQGEALVGHLHEAMKDEDPRLFCFDVKKAQKVRGIDLNETK